MVMDLAHVGHATLVKVLMSDDFSGGKLTVEHLFRFLQILLIEQN